MAFSNEHTIYNKLIGRDCVNGKNPEKFEYGKRNCKSVIKHLQQGNSIYQFVLVLSVFPCIFLSLHFSRQLCFGIPFIREVLQLWFCLSSLTLHIFKLLPSFVKAKIHQKYCGRNPTGEERKGTQKERYGLCQLSFEIF